MPQPKVIFSAGLIILVVPTLMIGIPILIWLLWGEAIKIALEVQPFVVLSLILCFLTITLSLGRYIFAVYMDPIRNLPKVVDNKFTLSTAKVAATLGITASQVRILIKAGKLKPIVNHKNCWLVCSDDLTPENTKLFKEYLKDVSSGVDIGLGSGDKLTDKA